MTFHQFLLHISKRVSVHSPGWHDLAPEVARDPNAPKANEALYRYLLGKVCDDELVHAAWAAWQAVAR
jgi:hypothetical protein